MPATLRHIWGVFDAAGGDLVAYNVSPDAPPARLDPEAGTSTTPASKPAGYRSADTYNDRAQERDSARERGPDGRGRRIHPCSERPGAGLPASDSA